MVLKDRSSHPLWFFLIKQNGKRLLFMAQTVILKGRSCGKPFMGKRRDGGGVGVVVLRDSLGYSIRIDIDSKLVISRLSTCGVMTPDPTRLRMDRPFSSSRIP
ncbi:hypothetical protein CFP56_031862 [Quercus suber]|uniref:Uncharacterized protein n=1 Tax=Quercus suber TaxID=58331 RepID=A0AAW0LST9_QUESU